MTSLSFFDVYAFVSSEFLNPLEWTFEDDNIETGEPPYMPWTDQDEDHFLAYLDLLDNEADALDFESIFSASTFGEDDGGRQRQTEAY